MFYVLRTRKRKEIMMDNDYWKEMEKGAREIESYIDKEYMNGNYYGFKHADIIIGFDKARKDKGWEVRGYSVCGLSNIVKYHYFELNEESKIILVKALLASLEDENTHVKACAIDGIRAYRIKEFQDFYPKLNVKERNSFLDVLLERDKFGEDPHHIYGDIISIYHLGAIDD